MRFKNLTITITLGFLSVVALAGLVMLPITNVICDVQNFGWTEDDGAQAAEYYNMKDIANESWFLIAGVNAKGVSASGSVGLLVKDRYTESQDTLFGNASLKVKRNAYTWYHKYAVYFRCNNKRYRDILQRDYYCGGHREPALADSNIAGEEGFKPFYDFTDEDGNPVPRHTSIALKAKVREATYRKLYGETDTKEYKMTLNVSAGYAFIDNEVMGEIRGQTVRAKSISETLTRERVINEANTSSHSVSLPFEKKAGSSATADVSFNDGEISSGSKTVTYTGIP